MVIRLSRGAKTAIKILEDNGYEAFAVGGCVRDSVMGKIPYDYDIATSALPEQMKKCFSGYKTIETGIKHGTITVLIDSEPLEITTFRIDKDYIDHRHPTEVVFTDKLAYDLERRDFTVNAMAYSDTAGIVDLFGGKEDIKNKVIRCVGDADTRFSEDALRIMRALRFGAVLGFDIEETTKISIHKNKELLAHIAKERIQAEINRLICADNPADIICEFKDVFAFVMGNFAFDLKPERLSLIGRTESDTKIRLALLFENLSGEDAASVLSDLKYDNNTKKTVKALLSYKGEPENTDRISIKKLLNKIGEENFALLCNIRSLDDEDAAKKAMETYCEIKDKNMCYTIKMLAVSGSDIEALGALNREIGEVLQAVLDAVIEEKLQNEKDEIISFIKNNKEEQQ